MKKKGMARLLKEHYLFASPKITNILLNNNRGVWKVKEANKEYMLKLISIKTGFPVVLNYELGKKDLMPKVVKTRDGALFVKENGKYVFVTEWIKTEKGEKQIKDPIEYVKAVANFHREAQFPQRFQSNVKPRILIKTKDDWLNIYREMSNKLYALKAGVKNEKLEKSFVDVIQIGEEMIKTMEAMNLDHYIEEAQHLGTVVHLDFNNANILNSTEQKPIIIDLDRAHISPQVCDFHLLLPTLLKMGAKVENLYQLLELYFTVYPNSRKYKLIYLKVCQFPHFFLKIAERTVKKLGDINLAADELIDIHSIELKKNELIKHWL